MAVVEARFSDDGASVVVRFSTKAAGFATDPAEFGADRYLAPDAVRAFGATSSSSARWASETELALTLGSGATAVPGDSIAFKAPGVGPAQGNGPSFQGSVALLPPLNPPQIMASLSPNIEVSPCGKVAATAAVLGAGRWPLRVTWACTSGPCAAPVVADAVSGARDRLTLTIGKDLPVGVYGFSVTVQLAIGGRAAIASTSIRKSQDRVPVLTTASTLISADSSEALFLLVNAEASRCDEEEEGKQNNAPASTSADAFAYLWTLPSGMRITSQIASQIDLTKAELALPRWAMFPGQTYEFAVAVSLASEAGAPHAAASLSVFVNVAEKPIQAKVELEGGRHVVGLTDTVYLSAAQSADLDFPSSQLCFSWTFAGLGELAATAGETKLAAGASANPKLSLNPAKAGMQAGRSYLVQVAVASLREAAGSCAAAPGPSARNATASVVVQVASDAAPTWQAFIDRTVPEDPLFATAQRPVQMRCWSPDASGHSWTVSDARQALDATAHATTTSSQTSTLVIDAGKLQLAADRVYTATCHAASRAGGKTASASAQFRVLAGPRPGSCSVLPKEGEALKTKFRVQCSQWMSAHSGAASLKYSLQAEQLLQALHAIAALADVISWAGTPALQADTPGFIADILAHVDVCSPLANTTLIVTLVSGAANKLLGTAAAVPEALPAAVDAMMKQLLRGAASCFLCGFQAGTVSGNYLSASYARACSDGVEGSPLKLALSIGAAKEQAHVIFPPALQNMLSEQRLQSDPAASVLAYARPWLEGDYEAAKGESSEQGVPSVLGPMVDAKVHGVSVAGLRDPVTFAVPFDNSAAISSGALLYYDEKASVWRSCGALRAVRNETRSGGAGLAWFADAACDHLTAFAVGGYLGAAKGGLARRSVNPNSAYAAPSAVRSPVADPSAGGPHPMNTVLLGCLVAVSGILLVVLLFFVAVVIRVKLHKRPVQIPTVGVAVTHSPYYDQYKPIDTSRALQETPLVQMGSLAPFLEWTAEDDRQTLATTAAAAARAAEEKGSNPDCEDDAGGSRTSNEADGPEAASRRSLGSEPSSSGSSSEQPNHDAKVDRMVAKEGDAQFEFIF
eukprot:tig00020951_g16436.t1